MFLPLIHTIKLFNIILSKKKSRKHKDKANEEHSMEHGFHINDQSGSNSNYTLENYSYTNLNGEDFKEPENKSSVFSEVLLPKRNDSNINSSLIINKSVEEIMISNEEKVGFNGNIEDKKTAILDKKYDTNDPEEKGKKRFKTLVEKHFIVDNEKANKKNEVKNNHIFTNPNVEMFSENENLLVEAENIQENDENQILVIECPDQNLYNESLYGGVHSENLGQSEVVRLECASLSELLFHYGNSLLFFSFLIFCFGALLIL